MNGSLRAQPTHSDVARLEAETGVRHEFVDGEVFAMAGGTPEHNQLSMNIAAELYIQLRGRPCRVVGSDQKIHILDDATDAGLYPDVSVICGPRERSETAATALTNPVVLVEVLSPSSEAYDRGRKFQMYRGLPSLRHYVLASQESRSIEVFDRNDDGTWTLRFAKAGDTVPLSAVGAQLVVDEVYAGVFDEE